jgi:6,7-dimethyl-8-ribityllumazine synthase
MARISLEMGVPVINGVLTTENEAQANDRASGKGRDCAQAAVEMANLMAALEPEVDDSDEDEQL